ncbi:MAG: energy transducer TonB [Hymenobacteraceae bacterium]|nr:energy transducer TonB [Hymenobacteraceae bacterium]
MPQTTKGVSTTTDTAAKAAPTMPSVGSTKPLPVADHYEGGQQAMYEFIAKELKYPATAKRNRIQGQCIIGFILKDDGSLENISVVKNIGGGCGEEALRVVRMLKFKAPGYAIKTSLPVMFKL